MPDAQPLAAVLHGPRDLRIEEVPSAPLRPAAVRVAIQSVGICGSDMHYFADGRNGSNVVVSPTVLGHEGFGVITETGESVDPSRVGERVAVEPALPCLQCETCLAGRYNVCRFGTCLGSPPTNGLLRSNAVIESQFAHPLPDSIGASASALIEPLAVAVWATTRAGALSGRRVLITGAGPIGLLVLQAALRAGASSVIVSDINSKRLRVAEQLGAHETLQAGTNDAPTHSVDVVFECSGSPRALSNVVALKPAGILLLVGVPPNGPVPFDLSMVQRHEIDVRGCFRYGPGAFQTAIDWAAAGQVNLDILVTARYQLHDSSTALETAINGPEQLKVLIDLPH